jgi:hypothetical protein
MFLPRFRHKTNTAEEARLKGSALILPAAFADIDIHKSRSVYYRLGRITCRVSVIHQRG